MDFTLLPSATVKTAKYVLMFLLHVLYWMSCERKKNVENNFYSVTFLEIGMCIRLLLRMKYAKEEVGVIICGSSLLHVLDNQLV